MFADIFDGIINICEVKYWAGPYAMTGSAGDCPRQNTTARNARRDILTNGPWSRPCARCSRCSTGSQETRTSSPGQSRSQRGRTPRPDERRRPHSHCARDMVSLPPSPPHPLVLLALPFPFPCAGAQGRKSSHLDNARKFSSKFTVAVPVGGTQLVKNDAKVDALNMENDAIFIG